MDRYWLVYMQKQKSIGAIIVLCCGFAGNVSSNQLPVIFSDAVAPHSHPPFNPVVTLTGYWSFPVIDPVGGLLFEKQYSLPGKQSNHCIAKKVDQEEEAKANSIQLPSWNR